MLGNLLPKYDLVNIKIPKGKKGELEQMIKEKWGDSMKDTKKIFKYIIPATDESDLQLPTGAQILSVMEQSNEIVLYAIVNTSVEVVKTVSVRVVGTGHTIDFDTNEYKFVGTVSLHGGALMFHVFCFDHGYCG